VQARVAPTSSSSSGLDTNELSEGQPEDAPQRRYSDRGNAPPPANAALPARRVLDGDTLLSRIRRPVPPPMVQPNAVQSTSLAVPTEGVPPDGGLTPVTATPVAASAAPPPSPLNLAERSSVRASVAEVREPPRPVAEVREPPRAGVPLHAVQGAQYFRESIYKSIPRPTSSIKTAVSKVPPGALSHFYRCPSSTAIAITDRVPVSPRRALATRGGAHAKCMCCFLFLSCSITQPAHSLFRPCMAAVVMAMRAVAPPQV
jgi:hypothetical protein